MTNNPMEVYMLGVCVEVMHIICQFLKYVFFFQSMKNKLVQPNPPSATPSLSPFYLIK